jgi:hypothetical protein
MKTYFSVETEIKPLNWLFLGECGGIPKATIIARIIRFFMKSDSKCMTCIFPYKTINGRTQNW